MRRSIMWVWGLALLSLSCVSERVAHEVIVPEPTALSPAHSTASTALRTHADHDVYQAGLRAYNEARFDVAVSTFSGLAADTDEPRQVRRDAFHYLGRAYMARREADAARAALTSMVTLEPPPVALDPDVEAPPLMRLYYEVRKAQQGGYMVEGVTPAMKTLAILDFTNGSVDAGEEWAPLGQGLPSLMIHQLNGLTDLKVVERERIQWLLEELDLQQTPGRVDQETAVQTGKLLGAHAVLLGSYIKHGKDLMIQARLVKVETSEIMLSKQVRGRATNFYDLMEELSVEIAKGISLSMAEARAAVEIDTRSLEAMMAYSAGLQLLEQGSFSEALDKFNKALELDPEYERARRRASSLWPLIADAG